MKTYDLWLGDDDACALFPSWRHRYWRSWTSDVVLVVVVLLIQGINHYSATLFFSVILLLFFLAMCIRNAIRALRCCGG
jgi:hypothetical protein